MTHRDPRTGARSKLFGAAVAALLLLIAAQGRAAEAERPYDPPVGSRWIIEEGLQPGSRVVVEGAPTRDGTAVDARPFTPAATANEDR